MRRLQTRIALTYGVLIAVAVALFTVLSGSATRAYLIEQRTEELRKRCAVLTDLFSTYHDTTLASLHGTVTAFARAMDLRITLIDSAGTVLLDSDVPFERTAAIESHRTRPEVRDALRTGFGTSTRVSATVHENQLYVAQRVSRQGDGVLRSLRVLRVAAQVQDIEDIASRAQTGIALSGIMVLLAVLSISLLVARRIATPITEIARAVERIRGGDLDARLEVKGNDEIAAVARAVNEMAEKLKGDIVQLKRLERVRSEFFGNVSHELRTPIFSLQGFLETLMEGAVDDPQVNRVFLKKAYDHAVRLNTLLEDLITISHIESGEMRMSFRYFNLHEFLEDIIGQYTTRAERSGVRLALDPSCDPTVEVLGDRERLQVVFENLLENAIKYNKPDGEVVVAYAKQNGSVRITVADTGVGIAEEHLPRIFERFYRVDKNRSREVGGTGLGLAIVKHIVEAHGSKVTVQSTVGKGSTFSFTLKA
jgi:two-component system phosphate regulon sensor histidine kinase PhoR